MRRLKLVLLTLHEELYGSMMFTLVVTLVLGLIMVQVDPESVDTTPGGGQDLPVLFWCMSDQRHHQGPPPEGSRGAPEGE